jgi:hypothetical protein
MLGPELGCDVAGTNDLHRSLHDQGEERAPIRLELCWRHVWLNELNPRRRVSVEISKPSNASGFETPRVLTYF